MSNNFFEPAPPQPVEPDDAAADLEQDFQATANPPEILVVQDAPPPIGRSWAFNFAAGGFVLGGGRDPLATNDLSTLIMWMEKCLRTSRGAHPIHPPGYGLVRRTELIGQLINGAPIAELEPRIRDALTFHPRVSDVTDFDWEVDSDNEAVLISFTVLLDDDTQVPLSTNLTTAT